MGRGRAGAAVVERLGTDPAPAVAALQNGDIDVTALTAPERSSLVAVQTPQAFCAEALRAAYAEEHDEATDCSTLVERRGGRVIWVEGDLHLHKVTTADDLLLVENWLTKERR